MCPMRYDYRPKARNLRNLGRIAIWNMNKIIIAIAIAIWLTDIALLIRGKYSLRIME